MHSAFNSQVSTQTPSSPPPRPPLHRRPFIFSLNQPRPLLLQPSCLRPQHPALRLLPLLRSPPRLPIPSLSNPNKV
ncbi:hypothetical protein Drorol1_Dr00025453, partial [Drosera rotundifolia]